uniref:Helix-turn-helix domain of transposase family ISL3 n=1 Tax=Candidatus Kentrum sp. LFY TaxID=2126342 RepID=A0A450X0D3_9GAMM|nr:MAG: Helix-turn-helix domain of transposase family ISL3 [Candidatus Kentron sp. LFY]
MYVGNTDRDAAGSRFALFDASSSARRESLIIAVHRVECLKCGCVRQVKIPFASPRRSCTKSFERCALELSRHMTIQDVAHYLSVSWDTIKDIQARYLHRRFDKPKLSKLKRIAIDEIY